MRKFKFVAIFAIAASLMVACDKNDDPEGGNGENNGNSDSELNCAYLPGNWMEISYAVLKSEEGEEDIKVAFDGYTYQYYKIAATGVENENGVELTFSRYDIETQRFTYHETFILNDNKLFSSDGELAAVITKCKEGKDSAKDPGLNIIWEPDVNYNFNNGYSYRVSATYLRNTWTNY